MAARRALVCAYAPPDPNRDSGARRAHDLIEFLIEMGWSVTFVASRAVPDPRVARALQRRGVLLHDGSAEPIDRLLAAASFDLALLVFWPNAEQYLPSIRQRCPSTRVIVDSVDLHLLRQARRIFRRPAGGAASRLDAEYAAAMVGEMNSYAGADLVLAVSRKEADLVNDFVGERDLAVDLPMSYDVPASRLPVAARRGIVFVGSFQHPPNVEAVEYLCREIVPRLDRSLLAEHPVYVVGNALDETVRRFGAGLPQVRMVGWVPSVLPYLERARVSVVPLLHGAGVKGKLIEAMLVGTPTVSTSVGVEGLDLRPDEHVLVADDPAAFAEAVGRLLADAELWTRLAGQGAAHARAIHGRSAVRDRFAQVVEAALARTPKTAPPPGPEPQPHEQRLNQEQYHQLVRRVREAARAALPSDATVLVVSRGDDALLELDGRRAWHFPQAEGGVFAGHYPADSAAAIAHLEELRARGADYLLLPRTSFWWLDHYRDLQQHLDRTGRVVSRDDACVLFDLRGPVPGPDGRVIVAVEEPGDSAPALASAGEPSSLTVGGESDGVRLIAFYLPQYHPIPENDAWWGPGFSEWTNVARASALFPGHYQPHLPADLGFYDLRLAETRQAQAELAAAYGIGGFCYYHYWFSGKRLLERPFEDVLRSGAPDFPFCLCWANEPWSRRWDGRPEEVLQGQTYGEADDVAHIGWLMPALRDPRAIKIDGKPLFLVYQGRDLPDPAGTTATWRREVAAAGLDGIYLLSVETGWDAGWDATGVGFDAKVLFQPQFSMLATTPRLPVPGKEHLRVYDYQRAWPILANPDPVPYRRYETIFPSWDNSPRRGDRAVVVHDSTPEAYEQWLRLAVERARSQPPDHRIVFINAWNEWGEGCHLEPDLRHGRAYLEATRRALWPAAAPQVGARSRRR